MATVDEALAFVLKHEGSRFTNDPKDPGGATKFGISLRFVLSADGCTLDLDNDGDTDERDIQLLELDDARRLYSTYFWFPGRFELVKDQSVATKVFDFAVHAGLRRSVRLLQHLLVSDFGKRLSVDGIVGPATLAAVNSVDPRRLVVAFSRAQASYYRELVSERPVLSRFIKGWLRRAADLP